MTFFSVCIALAMATQAAAFGVGPILGAPRCDAMHISQRAAVLRTRSEPVRMILPSKPPGSNDPEASPEAIRKTLTRVGILWACISIVVACVGSSGKSIGLGNAPGFAEQNVKKEAASKAYLKEQKDRVAAVKERAEADKAAGRGQTAPPKPWEKL
eukprot:CAMPEP_0115861912 /NCGR_PEP_ID=MMETSP0287-20121206/17903_1 /TAXON_ID=412157 /ORGANISM="Chrysochromulina rotalis, Strain UIO044" /LENGTH=155 /DNA_ID=CAMNT_0003316313 /DNA_START=18 /DNA_END=485 /DNA_ORIENTATION=+